MFIAGVSTRRVEEVVKPLLGRGYSAQSISNITKRLDLEVRKYHRRKLEDKHLYLIFDGVVLKGKDLLGAKKRSLLCCHGIDKFGHREMIDFTIGDGESEADWTRLANSLYKRGLTGETTDLIIVDGSPGLRAALNMVYPEVDVQRCWVHKLRNVSNKLKKSDREKCISEARRIYLAPNQKKAVEIFRKWEKSWREKCPEAVDCLKKDLSDLLHFLTRPKQHQIMIRTTNVIERTIREIRRRTRPMNSFTNDKSIHRIIYAIFDYLNRKWQIKPIKGFKIEKTDGTPPPSSMLKAA
jgi:putative transposase